MKPFVRPPAGAVSVRHGERKPLSLFVLASIFTRSPDLSCGERKKLFSFEKENQKTFIRSLIPSFGVPRCGGVPKTGKVFLLLFLKTKEGLFFSMPHQGISSPSFSQDRPMIAPVGFPSRLRDGSPSKRARAQTVRKTG
jgi:hypothetical protein